MTLKVADCSWQGLMDIAYDRWQKHQEVLFARRANDPDYSDKLFRKQSWSFGDMLDHCEGKEAEACMLGKLNQQIENGGVIQWVDNGYALDSIQHGLFDLLQGLGKVSREIADFLRDYCEDFMDEESGEIEQFDDADLAWQEAMAVSDRLSDRFYKLQDEWHPEVYAFLEDELS